MSEPDTPALNIAQCRRARIDRALQIVVPIIVLLAALVAWEAIVRIKQIPHYIIPTPSLVAQTLIKDWHTLAPSLWFTLELTFAALAMATLGGVLLAIVLSMSRWAELAFLPFAVILQVTPIVAIAPLIMIYVDSTFGALLICAWIVAFFPILSNTIIGLRSADHNLRDLFQLYRASPSQRMRWLLIPSSLPYFLGGLKIAGGLALIGAVVAEFVAGATGKNTGLASRVLEASFRTEIPRMFAALVLICLCGVLIYLLFNGLSRWLLGRWHESELKGDR
ncbi:MAG: ABC transporter permease [Betaproteobacteria bacterium]|nr:ABC transporter permease [Betaproteobacteria bacterium]